MSSLFDYYDIVLVNESLREADEFICGTEYEIEDIRSVALPGMNKTLYNQFNLNPGHPQWVGKFGLVHDGSLRNQGIEFITAPLTYQGALEAFNVLHSSLGLGPDPYTVRTSTHVHVNVASMDMTQIRHMLLIYALLEPVFFAQVKEYRKHNIHCVPLNYTILPTLYSRPLPDLVKSWSKYSALNLMPVKTQGTVEFRHLHGTGDIGEYSKWLTMLKSLWTFAFTQPTSALFDMLHAGCSPEHISTVVLGFVPDDVDFSASVIDVKLAF